MNNQLVMTKWPNFFVVGAPKAGTTFLFEHLRGHPEVFMPRIKEPSFFGAYPAITFENYRALYARAQDFPVVADFSPFYLSDPEAARKIHEVSPDARILILIRDPVARAHSQYLMYRRTEVEPESVFLKALQRYFDSPGRGNESCRDWKTSREYVEPGMYGDHVRRYIEVFGPEQVQVLLFNDLTRNPRETMLKVARHIEIDPAPIEGRHFEGRQNSFRMPRYQRLYRLLRDSKLRKRLMLYLPDQIQSWLRESPVLYGGKKPSLDPEARRFLQNLYDQDITQLEALLGRSFAELRESWI